MNNTQQVFPAFRVALLAAVALAVAACQPKEAGQEEAVDAAPAESAAHGSAPVTTDVGGSYNPDGVAPFGMASRQPKPVADAATEAPEAAATESLAAQNQLFGVHCQSCHGADGKGIEPLGVTLVGSTYVQSKTEAELVAMLKVGRMPGDPDSVKGRVMPGFAWMTDEQLNELAGFLKAQN